MARYDKELVEMAGFAHRNASTPAEEDYFAVDDSAKLQSADREHLHSVVAKALFLSMRARPEIVGVVNMLCTKVSSPSVADQIKLERLVNYLRCSEGKALTLGVVGPLRLFGLSDASYAVHHGDSYKSQSGGVLTFGIGCFYASANKQSLVTKSAG